MNITKKQLIIYLIWCAVLIAASNYICSRHYYNSGYKAGYIDACVDFYHGHLKYDLQNLNGKNVWVKVK